MSNNTADNIVIGKCIEEFNFKLKAFCEENEILMYEEYGAKVDEHSRFMNFNFSVNCTLQIDTFYNSFFIYYTYKDGIKDKIDLEIINGDIYISSNTEWNQSNEPEDTLSNMGLLHFLDSLKDYLLYLKAT